jgi:hypothetical protein
MSRRSIALILKQFRFELVVIVGVLLGMAALEVVVLLWLPGLEAQAAVCGPAFQCPELITLGAILVNMGQVIPLISSFVGGAGAIILGVAVVGREVERGTATLAWPLARSRRRWLATRVVVVGAILMLAAAAPAMVANLLVPVVRPEFGGKSVFFMFETRGLLPIGRDVAAFAVAILAGAAFGRLLPGLLLALVLASLVYWVQSTVNGAWRTGDAVVMPDGEYDVNLVLDSRLRDASGQILTWNEASDRDRLPDGSFPDGWPDSKYEQVTIGLPGSRQPGIDRREAGLYGIFALLLIGASAVVVDRRRPY